MQVDGAKTLTQDELLERSKLRPGDFYNKGQTDLDVQVIQALYGYRGYTVATDKKLFFSEKDPGVVRVVYDVDRRKLSEITMAAE